MSDKATKKHKAIVHIRIEIHDVLDTGECSGHPVKLSEYPEYGLRPSMLISVDGFDRHDCLTKLKAKLQELAK